MTYSPSESEKRAAAGVQALAGVFFFIAPLIGYTKRPYRSSPYLRYWSKACLIWSIVTTVFMVTGTVVGLILEIPPPAAAIFVVHLVFCIVGALSSYFNTPFKYWIIADRFCEQEFDSVYGQMRAPRAAQHKGEAHAHS